MRNEMVIARALRDPRISIEVRLFEFHQFGYAGRMDTRGRDKQVALRTALAVNGLAVPVLLGGGFSMVGLSPPEFSYARYCFTATALLVALGGSAWLISTDLGLVWRMVWGVLIGSLVFIMFPLSIRWINTRQEAWLLSQAVAMTQNASKAFSSTQNAPADASTTTIRSLSHDQERTIKDYLYQSNFYAFTKRIEIWTAPTSDDVQFYASGFARLFTAIGIEPNIVNHDPTGIGQTGIMVAVLDVKKPSDAAKILFDALSIADLSPKFIPSHSKSAMFALFIGPQ